jgi:hypothetical protein
MIIKIKGLFEMRCRIVNNRYDLISKLPKQGIVGEVGVAYGDFTAFLLLELNPLKFYAIDNFKGGFNTHNIELLSVDCFEYYSNRFKKEITDNIVVVKNGLSWEELNSIEDNYFDLIYIDAAHDYESVMKDIEQSLKKIKNGGTIVFDDCHLFNYGTGEHYGVNQAIREIPKDFYTPLYFSFSDNNIAIKINK